MGVKGNIWGLSGINETIWDRNIRKLLGIYGN